MSLHRKPRQNHRVTLALAIKPPVADIPPEDPQRANFSVVYVTQQKKKASLECTSQVYQMCAGKYQPHKGWTGFKDSLPAVFRLIQDEHNIVVDIDMIPEQEVLFGMKRKDLEGVEAVRLEVGVEGGFRILRRPSGVTIPQLLDLLKALDPVAEVRSGDTFGGFTVVSAEGRHIEITPPEPEGV